MARKKYDYQEIPFGVVIAMAILIPVITLLLMFRDHATHDTPARIIVLNTSSSQPLQSQSVSSPQLDANSNANVNGNGNSSPTPKDLTMPTGFRNLKWGDGIEKLNHPVLVTDNENNVQVAGYYVDSEMHDVPQCYAQKSDVTRLGMTKLDEVDYCFTGNHFSEVQIYRKLAYARGYNNDNCDTSDCLADKDVTWHNIFVDYLTHTYGTEMTHTDESYHMVADKFWQDTQGRIIKLSFDNYSEAIIATDAYDDKATQAIAMGMDKCNRATAEGN